MAVRASAALSGWGVEHRLTLHGGTDYQPEALVKEFREALAGAPAARHTGLYRAGDFPALVQAVDWVVMPSVWYENAPLVLMEAALHGRPVICSGVGGMAEMVRDGVDGLHAPVNDPLGLADAMRQAAETPGLWDRLRAGLRPPRSVEAMAEAHLALYRTLLGQDAAPKPARRKRA